MSLLRDAAHELDSVRLNTLARMIPSRRNDPLVFVLGTGRGGTTTYMNMLRDGLGAACLWEPLRPGSSRRAARAVPPHEYPRLKAGQRDEVLASYLDDLVERRTVSRWSASHTSLTDLLSRPALVVKEVRANRMVGWIQERYPDAHLRVLMRHPIAVVSSMLRAGRGWSEMSWDLLVPPAADALGCRVDELALPTDPRELHMFAVWLADTVCVLRELTTGGRTSVEFYESLRAEPLDAVRRATAAYRSFDESAAIQAISTPSDTASEHLNLDQTAPLPDLEAPVTDRIQTLLARFGVGCYSTVHSCPAPEALPGGLYTP